ncbi:type III secretion system ATPase SctN [Bradyrhizobium sp. LHD-71]|uniref:type III secretion system ATPase SctN n=1 Tax=Bradyrhizobium sp. LHD-71 TaxID=3072141 RepID=UPI00280E9F7B|nr:type III secretion system ATPase SctN [Bradyrhizobium sp. LHD-71]MDQ8726883.1 type III secretion system ATPase SctN [Bradyrhizobium sp. LHD-71]
MTEERLSIRFSSQLPRLRDAVQQIDTRPVRGRVTKAVGTLIHAVVPNVRIGELCTIADAQAGHAISAEVVGFTSKAVLLTPIGELHGLSMRSEVIPTGRTMTTPVGDNLLGRIIDSLGRALDGGPPINRRESVRPLHGPAPNPLSRQLIDRPFNVGLRAVDGLLSCGEGQRLGIYGEPGSGKSWLVAHIVKNADADVAVVGMIGERGREVREFIARQLGEEGLKRSVLVVATSDKSPIERLKAAYVATAIAEHFRDSGRRVLLLIDSITRFARAAREIGLAAGEPPTRRGFPPSIFATLPQLIERAGMGERGSVTAFYTVLVEGDGTGDPIAEETRGILDGHIVLSRTLASSGHFPAIDVLASRSRLMEAVVSREHAIDAGRLRSLLARYAEIEFLIQVGEYKQGADKLADEAVAKIGELRSFLRQSPDERTTFEETRRWMARLASQ